MKIGANVSSSSLAIDDFHFPANLISIQDCRDKDLLLLKSYLMAALAKEVKSSDEDNWVFEGPRSRINRPCGLLNKHAKSTMHSFVPPK
ncbi:hypothetical protein LguiB_010123 [Lonicera macranthoides]